MYRKPSSTALRLLALSSILLLTACDKIPGLGPDPRVAQREEDAKAIGGACRHAGTGTRAAWRGACTRAAGGSASSAHNASGRTKCRAFQLTFIASASAAADEGCRIEARASATQVTRVVGSAAQRGGQGSLG